MLDERDSIEDGTLGDMDGRIYLEGLISDQFGCDAGEPTESRAALFNLVELRGVAQGLVAAGALDTNDASAIIADLTTTLDDLGWLPHVRFSSRFSPRGEFGTATTAGVSRREWRDLAENPRPPALIAVHSLAGQRVTVGEIDYSLVALELWTTLFRVTYAWTRPRSDNPRDPGFFASQHLEWSAVDDRGRTYRARGGGSHGGAVITFGGQDFEPRLDREANRLTVTLRADNDAASANIDIVRN